MGHFKGGKHAKFWRRPPFFSSHQQLGCSICHCTKFKGKNNGQFRGFITWTLSTEKSRKFGEKIAKNSGKRLSRPILELKLSYGSRIEWYQNYPPIPLGGGEIWGQNLKINSTFLQKGSSPTPQILYCWKPPIKAYKRCYFAVSRPRNKKVRPF